MSAWLPILGFVVGWSMNYSSWAERFKQGCATTLAWFFIPFIIIYQMLNYQAGSLIFMLVSFFTAVMVYAVFSLIFKDTLIALCASYVNIGWLGFPLALLIFGQDVSAMMIALYIGSSIFGNIYAVRAVSTEKLNILATLNKLRQTPAMMALMLGVLLHELGIQHRVQLSYITEFESWVKVGMVLTGMAVLGTWFGQTKVTWHDLKTSISMMSIKLVLASSICLIISWTSFTVFKAHLTLWFFLFCLPPAANIVALETHYQGTGKSAHYIAAGTITSLITIMLFAIVLQVLN